MKSFQISFALVAIAVASVTFAQTGPGRPGMGGPPGMGRTRPKPGEREKKMLDQLNLSPAQKKKADHLIEDMVAKVTKMRPAGGGRPSPEMMDKFRAVRKDFDAKLTKILTPAQNAKLEKMRAEMRAKFGGMRRGGPGGPGGPGPQKH